MKAFAVVLLLMLQQVMAGTIDSQLVTQASNQFANDLYQKLAQKPGNVLVCPISLHVALTLLLQGAGGSTATQLSTVLKLGAATNANVKEGYKTILNGIQDDVLQIANKLYPAAGYQLNPEYLSVAREYFLSEVEGLNYSNPVEAAKTINDFVAEKTNNKIQNLISPDSLTELTRLIIVNAVHFQATWKSTFTTTYEDYFKVTPDNKVKTMLMTQTSYFGYKEDPALGAKVLKMDYNTEGYSMVFILPDKEDGLPAVEAKLADTSLEDILKDLKDTRVEVTIPKFKVEQTLELKEILKKMGLEEVFSPRADLHGLAKGDNLYVSDVIQKTFINVHENGTEAAAATVFLETLSANPDLIIFYAKRPFLYYLIHSTPSLVLFGGRFVRPQEQSDSENQESFVFMTDPLDKGNQVLPATPTVQNQQQHQQGQQTNKNWQQQNQQQRPNHNLQHHNQNWQQQNQQGQQNQQQPNHNLQHHNQNWQQQNQQGQQPNHNLQYHNQNWQQQNQQRQQPNQNLQHLNQHWQQHNQNWPQNQIYDTQHFQTQNSYQQGPVASSPQVAYTGQPGYPPPISQSQPNPQLTQQQYYEYQAARRRNQQGYDSWGQQYQSFV